MCMLGACGGQKKEVSLLELELQTVVNCGCWELNPDPLEEKLFLLMPEPSLQPCDYLAFELFESQVPISRRIAKKMYGYI